MAAIGEMEAINSQIDALSVQMEQNSNKAAADQLGLRLNSLKIRKAEFLSMPSSTFTAADKAEFDALGVLISALENQISGILDKTVQGGNTQAPVNKDAINSQLVRRVLIGNVNRRTGTRRGKPKMATELRREMGEISRSSEFFSIGELQAQTGQAVNNFGSVAIKELMDNAIDACEVGNAPEVALNIVQDDDHIQLSVQDNGDGIAAKTINRIKDFDVRVSDKLIYIAPSRGQQGNALKTILGMSYALGSTEPVIITARNIKHTIYASPDSLGNIDVKHSKEKMDKTIGTTVSLTLSRQAGTSSNYNPIWWARSYALFNPHVSVQFDLFNRDEESYQDNSEDQKIQVVGASRGKMPLESNGVGINSRRLHAESVVSAFQQPTYTTKIQEYHQMYQSTVNIGTNIGTGKSWHKFMTNESTSPSWYDQDTFRRLISTYIKNGTNKTLRDFVMEFRGLSRSSKAKEVCDQFPGINHLSDLKDVSTLLKIMIETATPPRLPAS